MKRFAPLIVAAGLAVAGLTACGDKALSGTVIERVYEPKRSATCYHHRGVSHCTSHPACYHLTWKNKAGVKGDACVSRTDFDHTKLGDHYAIAAG